MDSTSQRTAKPRSPVIKLQSTASYTRPTTDLPFAGVPRATTYMDTYSKSAADRPDMNGRCIASLKEKKLASMLVDSLRKIPIDRIVELRVEADASNAAETAKMLATQTVAESEAAARMRPEPAAALTAMHETIGAMPRHAIKPGCVSEFFSAGSAEGPFPGSRSEQGEVAAGGYWMTVKPGKYMVIPAPKRVMADGRKFPH